MVDSLGDIPIGALLGDPHLEHFGIKGMKWGVINKSRKAASKFAGNHPTNLPTRKKKVDVSKLTTTELKKRNERLTLEKKHKELTTGKTGPKKNNAKKLGEVTAAIGGLITLYSQRKVIQDMPEVKKGIAFIKNQQMQERMKRLRIKNISNQMIFPGM